MRYYIFIEEMDGNDSKAREWVKPYNPIVIEAESKEAALGAYLEEQEIGEEDAWRFYPVECEKADAEEQMLSGMTWDEFLRDLYPERPIEL